MANNHEQFKKFNNTIKLNDDKKETLEKNRGILRDKIKKYFTENKHNEIKPKFHSQGSFEMKTTVNPIPRKSDENKDLYNYDIDDGVYFIGEEDKEDRYVVDTYHEWIYDAVKDHTSKGAIKKNTCVRVLYADGHHIDLPIYYKQRNVPELAHKSKDWIDSDPREFYKLFNEKAASNQQLRRIVRYLKAWCDFRNFNRPDVKMPSGFIMTILATDNLSINERDDVAFKETLEKIKNKLDNKFECKRPTTPKGENLLSDFSDTRREYFLAQLNSFITSASQALEINNHKESCLKWQKHFGDRFSCSNAKDEDEASSRSYSSAAVITQNAKSA